MTDKDCEWFKKLQREADKKDEAWLKRNEELRKKVQQDIEKKNRNKRDRKSRGH